VMQLLYMFINFNLLLAIFNLIPIHPLDGFNVVAGLLPKKYYHDWMELSRYGMIFLILLIFPFFGNSPITTFIQPIISFLMNFLIPSRLGGII
jgi:Zn-dependent protease